MGGGSTPCGAPSDNTINTHIILMKSARTNRRRNGSNCQSGAAVRLILLALIFLAGLFPVSGQRSQSDSSLTPRQRAIEKQRSRLLSSDPEERRDAVMRLGAMKRADSSRTAAVALGDPVPIIRATAASAVLSMPSEDVVPLLVPMLNDKKEFVRQQVAHALGETHNSAAVEALVTAFERDKMPSVRAAAAIALGTIGDESASSHLARAIDPRFPLNGRFNQKGRKKEENDRFVQLAAARSLGQMRSRASVPVLIGAMSNTKLTDDVRREAVVALGLIGDSSAVPVLRTVLDSTDPYLSRAAFDALAKISRQNSNDMK